MINKLTLIPIFVVSSCYAQQKAKSDLYLYFKPDSLSYKMNYKQAKDITRKGKVVSPRYDYDVYTWQYFSDSKIRQRYKLITVNKGNYSFRDSAFVKTKAKTFKQMRKNKAIFYDSSDAKRFLFRNIFIVEYTSPNKYKIVQVQSYIGSNN